MPNFPPNAERNYIKGDGCNPPHPGRSQLKPHLFTPGPKATDEFLHNDVRCHYTVSVCIRYAFLQYHN